MTLQRAKRELCIDRIILDQKDLVCVGFAHACSVRNLSQAARGAGGKRTAESQKFSIRPTIDMNFSRSTGFCT